MATEKNESAVPKRRGRPPKTGITPTSVLPVLTSDTRAPTANGDLWFTYHVTMYVPDPRQLGSYFTYDGTVCREAGLNSGADFDVLLQGLADHVFAKRKVRVHPHSIVIQRIELIPPDATADGEASATRDDG